MSTPSKINNPHDKFIKTLLRDKGIALGFLHEFLPDELKNILDLDSLTYADTNYVDEEMEEHFLDLVFDLHTKQEIPLQLSILVEHKSYPR